MLFTPDAQQDAAITKIKEWYRDSNRKQVFYMGGLAGTGKAQPLDEIIQTPIGPRLMGEIKEGDAVFGRDGWGVKVVGVFPQGIRPCYRVIFRDNTSTRCDADHLWTVDRGARGYQTLTTREMFDAGTIMKCGLMRFRAPLNEPVRYSDPVDLPVKPWLLGALIGDGSMCRTQVSLTVADTEHGIGERATNELPEGVYHSRTYQSAGCSQWGFSRIAGKYRKNTLMMALRQLGLNVKGSEKFVPREYLQASVDDRIELLRGLMDTDGSIRANRVSFSTSSNRLADDVCTLVRSLGGVAVKRTNVRKRTGKAEYDVNVKTNFNPFWFERKASMWTPSLKNPPSKYIRGIVYEGEVEQQCIMVDADDGLYLTNDFIVTHNTSIVPNIIDALNLDIQQVAFLTPTGMAAKVLSRKLRAQDLVVTPTTIHKAMYQPRMSKPEILERDLAAAERLLRNDPASKLFQARVKMLAMNLDRAYDIHEMKFALNPESTLATAKLIIVDESSMVGLDIANDLKSFDVPIIAIGDPGQLQPVEGAPGLCIGRPDAMLSEIHRQAKDNPIILFSHLVRQGEMLEHGDYGELKIVRPQDDEWTFAPDRDAQIICGMNRSRWEFTSALRQLSGHYTNTPQEGEPLMICKNSQTHTGLVNGTLVTSAKNHLPLEDGNARLNLSIVDEDGLKINLEAYQGLLEEHEAKLKGYASAEKRFAFKARMKAHHVDFGWVITCHKAQGSSWPNVIVHDESGAFRDQARNWAYTAATRAEKTLIFVRP